MIAPRRRLTTLATSVAGWFLTTPVFAQGTPTTPSSQIQSGLQSAAGGAGYTTGETDLTAIIGSLISTALGLLGILLLVYLLYGGFLWMTAGGDEGKVKKARQLITNAVIGLVIIVAAYAIANFVIGSLVNVTGGGTGEPTG